MSWKKVLLLPAVARLALRAPKDVHSRWDAYWQSVGATGSGGEVLWDSASRREAEFYLEQMRRHVDAALPVVDVGCGNGRFTRLLAGHFPYAVGVDLSPSAVARATEESRGVDDVRFRALDVTAPGAGALLAGELGEANVFVRGLFHTLRPSARLAMAGNLREVLGRRGRLVLAETDFRGSILDYLEHLGATPGQLPTPLQRLIAFGVPRPRRFGEEELRRCFPSRKWISVASGPMIIDAVSAREGTGLEGIPGYFAVLAARRASPTPPR